MSNRPAVKSAFANLRPSIVREPARSAIAPEAESKLLEVTGEHVVTPSAIDDVSPPSNPIVTTPVTSSFHGGTLLTKKRRELLVPVTFRIPHSLKEKLNEIAKRHELNQTDLINEGIELNLQRYS